MLSNYYKKLRKLHDISADAFEISDQESEGESEGIPVTPHARKVRFARLFTSHRCAHR